MTTLAPQVLVELRRLRAARDAAEQAWDAAIAVAVREKHTEPTEETLAATRAHGDAIAAFEDAAAKHADAILAAAERTATAKAELAEAHTRWSAEVVGQVAKRAKAEAEIARLRALGDALAVTAKAHEWDGPDMDIADALAAWEAGRG